MKKRIRFIAIALTTICCTGTLRAQLITSFSGDVLLPANPTSADNLRFNMQDRTCGGLNRYTANPYRVNMSQNNITVKLGERLHNPVPLCPGAPREEIDLGRLPAGNYTLTVIETTDGTTPSVVVFSNEPFTIADARLLKTMPYVRLDYSGHWWDPNDPGWGLFIWHDARDNVLAAWFTYGADGKPIWYVFQPTWQTVAVTVSADLLRTSRAPGTTIPPPNPTTYTTVGSASLDFTTFVNPTPTTPETGKLTYTFTGGPTTVRNIQRFKP